MNNTSHSLSSIRISQIAILSALSIVLKYAFSPFPNVQPITAIFLATAVTIGFVDSILIMMISILISSFLWGIGPWTVFQILSFSLIISLWKYIIYPLICSLKLQKHIELFAFSIFSALLGIVYGVFIDSLSALLYGMPWWSYIINGMSFNLAHAISTAIFFPITLAIINKYSISVQ